MDKPPELVQSEVVRYFEKLGVRVRIPPQEEPYESLTIEGPEPYDEVDHKTPDVFELIRLVINFYVKGDGQIVTQFSPEMELEVELTKHDFGHVGAEQELKLAFWDVNKKEWVLLPTPVITRREATVVAKVSILDWGDPGVGVGR
jgi:hypothetical protein